MITGSFKSFKGVLKFLANSSFYKSSISIVSRLRWLAISDGSPRTSLTPTGSNEPSMSNLHLWGGGGGSNVTRGGRFCNLLDLLIGWSSTIENLTNQTLKPTKHKKNHRANTTKFPKVSTITRGIRYAFLKKVERQFLSVLEEVLRHKRMNHPSPSYTFNKGYLPIPSKVN